MVLAGAISLRLKVDGEEQLTAGGIQVHGECDTRHRWLHRVLSVTQTQSHIYICQHVLSVAQTQSHIYICQRVLSVTQTQSHIYICQRVLSVTQTQSHIYICQRVLSVTQTQSHIYICQRVLSVTQTQSHIYICQRRQHWARLDSRFTSNYTTLHKRALTHIIYSSTANGHVDSKAVNIGIKTFFNVSSQCRQVTLFQIAYVMVFTNPS